MDVVTVQIVGIIASSILMICSFFVSLKISKVNTRFEMFKYRKETIDMIQQYFSNSYDEKKIEENALLYHKIFSNIVMLFDVDLDDNEALKKFENFRAMADEAYSIGKNTDFNNKLYCIEYKNLIAFIRKYKKLAKY